MISQDAENATGMSSEPIHVAMITSNWIYGGRERVVKALCEGFRELLGWDVTVIVARCRDSLAATPAERFPEPNGTMVRWLETDRLRGIVVPLSQMIRELRPDVVFWHADIEAFSYYWLASALAGRGSDSRVVPVYHGILPILDLSVRSRLAEHLSSRVARVVPQSVAVSEGTSLAVQARFQLRPDTVRVIYDSIDAMDTSIRAEGPEPRKLMGKRPVVLVVARLSPQKDWDTLIEAFRRVVLDMRATLCIVGEGEERKRILRLAQDAGVADCIVLTGNEQNPYLYMSHADVFVLCSHYEGFGMVLLEAMACGVPVVATDCESGPREIITHGQNGLLVAPEDPAALADGILSVLRDTDLAGRLRQGGLKRAEEFTLRDTVLAYRQVAERVCRSRGREAAQSDDGQPVRKTGSHAGK